MTETLGDERHMYEVMSLAMRAHNDIPTIQEGLADGSIDVKTVAIHVSWESGQYLDACRQVGETATRLTQMNKQP